MNRRSILQLLAAAATALPWRASLAQSQASPLTQESVSTLRAVAAAVLPSTPDGEGTDAVVDAFLGWLRGYRSEADMGFGYGIVRKRLTPTIAPATYIEQLAALESAAVATGTALGRASVDARRRVIASALDAPGVKDFPASPNGGHVVADLMSFYFNGTEANDLCYRAKIGRDRCRTLAGSSQRPASLGKS